jgi:hypothetical protein
MNLSAEPQLRIDRRHEYQVDGNVAALYMTRHGIGPVTISPFVILAASVDSIEDFTFDIRFARAVIPDQETMDQVEEIFDFLHTTKLVLGDPTQERLIQLATDVGADVSWSRTLNGSNGSLP